MLPYTLAVECQSLIGFKIHHQSITIQEIGVLTAIIVLLVVSIFNILNMSDNIVMKMMDSFHTSPDYITS